MSEHIIPFARLVEATSGKTIRVFRDITVREYHAILFWIQEHKNKQMELQRKLYDKYPPIGGDAEFITDLGSVRTSFYLTNQF